MMFAALFSALFSLGSLGCDQRNHEQAHRAGGDAHQQHEQSHHGAAASSNSSTQDTELTLHRVASVHGEAGPWAVAGFRMGQYAIKKLGVSAYTLDLEVVHRSPKSPQFACVADGASAATGASVGKLNLAHEEADEAHVETVFRRRSTQQTLVLRPTAGFANRFKNIPFDKLRDAGRQVMQLAESEVFEEVR